MRLSKKQRDKLRFKYNGLCAYCGFELSEKWHADHLEPVIRLQNGFLEYPDNDKLSNMMPSCSSCNLSKGRQEIEGWRLWIKGHINSLNKYHPIYKISKRYGLIIEIEKEIIFHFEKEQQK